MTVSNYPCVLCSMRLLLLLSTIFLPSSSRFLIETLHHKELSKENGANNYPGNVETVVEEEGVDYADDANNEDNEEKDQRGNEPDKYEQVEEAVADYTDNEDKEEKDQIDDEPDKDDQMEKDGADFDQDVVSTTKFPDKMSSQISQRNKSGPNGNDYMGGPPTGSQRNILNSEEIDEYMKKQQTDQTVKSPQSRSLKFRSIFFIL